MATDCGTRDYWKERWDNGQTKWQKPSANPLLVKHHEVLLNHKSPNPRILIPLSGKSLDILFFADLGFDVFAVEFVEKAMKEFRSENDAWLEGSADVGKKLGDFNMFEFSLQKPSGQASRQGKIFFLIGDIFYLANEETRKQLVSFTGSSAPEIFDAIYDRASIVALKPETMERYVATIYKYLKPKHRILCITAEYDQEVCANGPQIVIIICFF